MFAFFAIARTGLDSLVLYPLRSLVVVACLVTVLLPYLVGLGLSHGVRQEAAESVRFGADLYVTGSQFGRDVPVPLAAADQIRRLEGVRAVVPRIVGQVVLGRDQIHAVLVGMPPDYFSAGIECVEGRLPGRGNLNELVVGTELAKRLHLHVGDILPPFYSNREGERLTQVVGIFRSDVSLWQAHMVFTTFDVAAIVFDQKGLASDLLVFCQTGAQEEVRRTILRSIRLTPAEADAQVVPRVTSREDLETLLPRGLLHREGLFNLLFVLVFAVAILVILVTSGVGLSARRREVGILKATGWQTDEVLLRDAVESLSLSVIGFSLSVLLAWVWLRWANGYWIAGVFLPGVGVSPSFSVPFRLTPVPSLLAFLLSFAVVMSGTLFSSWRAATMAPFLVIRSVR
jgi:ABC-type lipoprotein release transport system permease subunit